jgi:hypothetical protein
VRIGISHWCTLRDERVRGCKITYGKRRYYKRDLKALNRQQRLYGSMVPDLYYGRSNVTILWRDKRGIDKEKDGMVLLAFRRGIQRLLLLRGFISEFSFNLKQSQKHYSNKTTNQMLLSCQIK